MVSLIHEFCTALPGIIGSQNALPENLWIPDPSVLFPNSGNDLTSWKLSLLMTYHRAWNRKD